MESIVVVGLLVIAGVWAVYLMPVVFGEKRDAPLSSTEAFDRWSHSMANVQKHSTAELASSQRERIRMRRRRTLMALGLLTVASFGLALRLGSMPWLLMGLLFVSLTVLYLLLLAQMRQRRDERLRVIHLVERPSEWEEPQIKVIAR
jgi:Ca2+/Na+ antiporter